MVKDPTKFFEEYYSSKKDDILGDEQIDPKTGLTEEEMSRVSEYSSNIPLRRDYRGAIPKAYERVLGEGGYHPEFGFNRTQEMLAEQQSSFGQFANAMNQAVVGEVIGGTIEGIGYLGKVLDVGSMVNGTEQEWGNTLSDIGKDLKAWTREVAPIYTSPDAPKFNPGDWSWWMSHAPSVASTLSLMLPAAGVVRGIGAAGKLVGLGKQMGKGAQWMATGIGQAVVSRHMENMMEASGVYDESFEKHKLDLIDKYSNQMEEELNKLPLSQPRSIENPGAYTKEQKDQDIQDIRDRWESRIDNEAKSMASLSAANTYKKQWAMLIQDIPQYLLLNRLGGMAPGSLSKESVSVIKRMGGNVAGLYGKKSVNILKDMLGEGGEEMYQFLVNEQSKALMKSSGDPAVKNSLLDVLKDNFDNGELWTSATFGALGAGVMQAAFAGINAKAIRKSNEARIENINRFGPIYQHAAAMFNEAVESGDPIRKDIATDNLIVTMAIAAKERGNIKHLKSFVNAMRDPSDYTLKRFGITENQRFLADNPEVADRILENIDQVNELYDRYVTEGSKNKNVKPGDEELFARNMTLNRFFVDRAKERIQSSQDRIDATENISDFNELSPELQEVKLKRYQKSAIKKSLTSFEKKLEKEKDTASKLQIANYKNIIAQAKLALDNSEEELKEAEKAYKENEDIDKDKDEQYDHLSEEQVNQYISELEAIENTKAAIIDSEEEMKAFREGKGYVPTQEEKKEYESNIDKIEGITPGDQVTFTDDAGNQRLGEVQYLTVAEFDSEGNPIDDPDSESADNSFIIQPLDENDNPVGDPIVRSGANVVLFATKNVSEEVSDVEDGLTYEEEDNIGKTVAYARDVEKARGVPSVISNLSYSHLAEDDPGVILVRNDKFNKVISDPNTSWENSKAFYYLDDTAVDEMITATGNDIRQLEANLKTVKKDSDLYKNIETNIKKHKRKRDLLNKMKDIPSLTAKDKEEILKYTSNQDFNDIGDDIRVSVRVNIGEVSYKKGLMLHASGYNNIKIPTTMRKRNNKDEIERFKNKKKQASRAARTAILKDLLDGKEPYTENLNVGRGAPRTISKDIPAKDRQVDPIELFNIKNPNKAKLAIATTTIGKRGGYYEPKLKTGANTVEQRITNISSVGSTYLITSDTINGEPYAYKFNNKHISKEHAELIYDSFILLARSNVIWNSKTGKFDKRDRTEKEIKKGIIGRYNMKFPKSETRVSGLSVGELLDLLVVHGEHLTNPYSGRYKKVELDEEHREVLMNKRLYLTLAPTKDEVPYLVFGTKEIEENEDGTKGYIPYQVDLRSEKEISAMKDQFVEWITENKTYAQHLVNKMLKLELNNDFLDGRVFRVGTKDKQGTFVRKGDENYSAFLLKNTLTADAEKGDNGLAFHAPVVDLNIVSSSDGSVNLKRKGDPVEQVKKPEVKVEDKEIKESLEANVQKQETKEEPQVVEDLPEYINQFNTTKKREIQVGDSTGEFKTFDADISGSILNTISGSIEELIKEGKDPSEVLYESTHKKDSNTIYKVGDDNKGLELFIQQRFDGVTNRTFAQDYHYGETLRGSDFGNGFDKADIRNQPVPEELPDPVEEDVASTPEVETEEKTQEDISDTDSVDNIMGDFQNDGVFGRRRLAPATKAQDLHKELKWVQKKLGVDKDFVTFTNKLNDLLLNGKHHWATYSHDGIMLLEGAEEGTLYHEAFHRVSLAYLSTEERKQLYKTARQVYKMPEKKRVEDRGFTDREVEEKLAEEFREYVLLRERNKPSLIMRVFDEIIAFFEALFFKHNRLTYTDVDAMFNSIYRGDFRFSKEAIGYSINEGAGRVGRQIKNTEFNSIVTRKQQKDLVKNLAARLFTVSNVTDLNDISSINFDLLKEDLIEKTTRAKNIANNQKVSDVERAKALKIQLMFDEVLGPKDESGEYMNFPIFKDLVENYMSFLGIRKKYDKEPDKLDNGLEETDVVRRGDSDYAVASYERSVKETALSSIKFMVSTLHESDVVDPVTNFKPFADFQEVWHRLLFDLHDVNSIDEMMDILDEVGTKLDYKPYSQLAYKLKNSSENTKIQFFTTFRKHRHEFVNFMFNFSKEDGASFSIEDASYEELSRNAALRWNENLKSDPNISTLDKDSGYIETNEEFFKSLNKDFNKVQDYLTDKVEEDDVTTEVVDKVMNDTLKLLGRFHVIIDRPTLDMYLESEEFTNDNIEDRLFSMLNEIDNFLQERTLDKNIISTAVGKALSKAWADAHPEKASDVNLGPENNKYYNYAQHSLATDIVNKINKDKSWIENKLGRIYNKNSVILRKLAASDTAAKNFSVVTFSKLAASRKGDSGRNFVNISRLEDYLIKQSALFDKNNLLPFPVMANRKTYFFMKGGFEPMRKVIEKSTSDNTVIFTGDVVDILYGYYKDEEERILTVKKTIDEYEKATGDLKETLKERLVQNLHYVGDFNTKGANGTNFIHFKGYKTGLSKEDFTSNIQRDLNNRLKEEVEYAAEIGVIEYNKEDNTMTNNAMSSRIIDLFEDENMPKNYEVLHALSHNLVNQMIAVMESEKIFIADPAQFKRTKNTDIDVFEDMYKRWFGVGSSGNKLAETVGDENGSFNVATFKDQPFESDYYQTIYDKHVELYTKSTGDVKLAERLATKRLSAYKSVDPTDGQMYISPEMYRKIWRRLGQWSDKKEAAYQLLQSDRKLTYAEELEALNIVLQPIKTVYIGHHDHDGIDLLIYDKMSMATIFRRNVKGTYLEEVLDRMEGKGKYEGLAPIEAIKFESAVKVGGRIAQGMFEDGQTRDKLTDLSTLSTYSQTFDNLKHQVETDVHDADRQKFGTQAFKSLISDIRKDQPYGDEFKTGQDLIDTVVKTRIALSDLGVDKVNAKLGISGDKIDNESLVDMLKADAKLAGKPEDFINALKVGEDGEMFLELDSFSDRRWVYNRIMSIVNKETVDLNLPGNQLIQVTDYGMNTVGKPELGFSYLEKGETEVVEMEARVSVRLFKKFVPGFDKMSAREKRDLVKSNLEAIGYRIPTQGQNSIVKLKIVELLDEQAGDVIHLPLEFTALTGSDFDIDKLFVATYNYTYDKRSRKLKKVPFSKEERVDDRYKRKALELFSIYRNAKNVISPELRDEINSLYKDRGENFEGKSDVYKNDGYLIKNERDKLDILQRRVDNAESEEEKKKYEQLVADSQERLDHLYFVTDIMYNMYDQMNTQLTNMIFKKVSSALINAGKLPTKEDFAKKSIEDQNTRLANENRLLDIFFTVLGDEKHYIQTSTPLGAETTKLKNKSNQFEELARGKKDRSLKPLKMGTPSFQAETKATFVGSDAGIGPFALMLAHHGLTQHVGLKMKSGLNFSFSEGNLLPFDRIEGEDGVNISSWLSALVDAHVDAVKDPYIIKLNVNQATNNVLSFLLRIGTGEVSFDFLAQPILKNYATLKMNEMGGITVVERSVGERDESMVATRNEWRDLYYKAGGKEEDLLETDFYIPLNEIFNSSQLKDNISAKTSKDKEYYRRQLSILNAFEQLNLEANHLKVLVMASRIDTKKYGSTPSEHNVFVSRIKQLEESGKWVNLPKLIKSDGEYVEGGTMLSPLLKNSVLYLGKALSKKSIYGTAGFNNILFNSLLYSTKAGNKASSSTIRMLTEELLSFMFGKFFSDFRIGPGLTTGKVDNMLYDKNLSIFNVLDKIKKGEYPNSEYLKDNAFIDALILDYSNSDAVPLKQNIKLPFRTLNDLWETDDYIDAFNELVGHPSPEVKVVAKLLYYYSYYSSGFRNRLYSYSTYIPSLAQRELEVKDPNDPSVTKKVSFNNFIVNLLEELSDNSLFTKYALDAKKEVFTNNWWNESIVPRVTYENVKKELEENDAIYAYEFDFDQTSQAYLGVNQDQDHVFAPYLLIGKPESGLLLEYVGYIIVSDTKVNPVYRVIPKKGFQSRGLVIKEYGLKNINSKGKTLADKSVIPENNPDTKLSLDEVTKKVSSNIPAFVKVEFENQEVASRNPIKDFFEEDPASELRDIVNVEDIEQPAVDTVQAITTKPFVKETIVDSGTNDKGEIAKVFPNIQAAVYFSTPTSGYNLEAARYYAKVNGKKFFIYMEEGKEDYKSYGEAFSTPEELRQLLINESTELIPIETIGVFGTTGEKVDSTDKAKFKVMLDTALEDVYETPEETIQENSELIPNNAVSSPSQPIEVFVDGSVKPGPEGELEYGYGAYTDFGGKASGISGANAKVEELLFSEFPELKNQKQLNPSLELLGTWQTVKAFENTSEHILIHQDLELASQWDGLWQRAIDTERKPAKPYKIKQPHIKYLIDNIVESIEKIEKNGGSVRIKWIPGHIDNAKIKKYPKVFQDTNGKQSVNLIDTYTVGNNNADVSAKSTTEKQTGLFSEAEDVREGFLNNLRFSNEQKEEGKDNVKKCNE